MPNTRDMKTKEINEIDSAALEVLPASLRYAETGRSNRERAALEVLRSTGIDVLEAALVAKEALEWGRGRVKRARECVRLGAEEMRRRERTVTFAKAVETALPVFASTCWMHVACFAEVFG